MSAVHVSTVSNQDYITPAAFLREVEARFGVSLVLDLAASDENHRCFVWFTESDDSLSKSWKGLMDTCPPFWTDTDICFWLNPPFRGVDPWMEKCKRESAKGCKIISLTLASLGTKWYRDHVEGNALSLVLRERITFEGMKDPFPKDLMLTLWGFGFSGLGFWSRKEIKSATAAKEKTCPVP